MFQYTRLEELLEYFITQKDYIAVTTLEKQFKVSQRTLRNDIRNLNEELEVFHAQILMKRRVGYYLDVDYADARVNLERMLKEKTKQLDSTDKRIHHLIIKMLYSNAYLSQDQLADEVFVSTNTIINYLKTIRIILSEYDLNLKTKANWGYIITGEELDKRRCIIDLITSNYQYFAFSFSKEQIALLDNVNLESIKEIVMQFNRKNDLHFSDYNLKNLILHIALSISRLCVCNQVETSNIPENDTVEHLLDPLILCIEQTFEVLFSQEERKYIYSHYVSNTNELLNSNKNNDYIDTLVKNILTIIYELYHFDLRFDMILEKDLHHHLQSILNAKYYNLNKKNPLLNTIKSNYILAFEVAATSLKQAFQNEPFKLTEDEVGYISLHIGAAIERYFDIRNTKHKKAVIVYHNGYAEGCFIATKLHTLFKDSLEIIHTYPSHEFTNMTLPTMDFVISTLPLKHINNTPVIVISIPLLKIDIDHIAHMITFDNVHPIDKISSFFDPDLFIHTQVSNKDEIIHMLCELLLKKDYVYSDFEESVIERECRIPTAMDGVVAMPHPMQIQAIKSKIAVCILDHPIPWSSNANAQIILMLALADDAKKDIEKLYDTFVSMMHNAPLQKLLFQAHSLEQFLLILKENLPNEDE